MDDNTDTNMKQQAEAITTVRNIMAAAMALPERLAKQLREARAVLEDLKEYQHPKIIINTSHAVRAATSLDQLPPAMLIEAEIKRINEILGDRA